MLVSPKRYGSSSGPAIVTWADGTDEEIAAMLAAHDQGLINIYDYWSVGDERSVELNAMRNMGSYDTAQPAQTIVYVLMDEGYMSQSGIHYVVGQKDLLYYGIPFDDSGYSGRNWSNSKIRTHLNTVYYNAIADNNFKALFKEFQVTYTTNNGAVATTTDKIALFAEREILGQNTYGQEPSEVTQIEYYKTSSNCLKSSLNTSGYSINSSYYWTRSVNYTYGSCVSIYTYSGLRSTSRSQGNKDGISPFMCI